MHKIGEIIFSRGIYEVELKQGRKSVWPFLRLNSAGKLLDSFCSCSKPCKHIDEAYQAVFREGKPLHVLYQSSFFYQLGQILFARWQTVKNFEDTNFSFAGVQIKTKNPKTKTRLKEFFQIRKQEKENEFSSLKFSALTTEELQACKEDSASLKLQYEVSFFSDFAKWLFLEKDLKAFFKGQPLPLQLELFSKNISLKIKLTENELLKLVPVLNTVNSSLQVFKEKKIKEAVFDQTKKKLTIIFEKSKAKKIQGLNFGPWTFVPKKGFYLKEKEPLLNELVLEGKKIAEYLNQNIGKLKNFFRIDLRLHAVKNNLFIDEKKNLQIESYLQKTHDLASDQAAIFYPWLFLKGKIIKKLSERPVFKIIEKEKVGEFVSESRIFLQNIDGFNIHFGAFEEKLLFQITKNEDLKFVRKLIVPKNFEGVIDYGNWVYVKNKGFFGKKTLDLPFLPKLVKKENIVEFLTKNKSQLEQIPNFFLEINPLKKLGLEIELNSQNKIVITPQIVPKKNVKLTDLKFFEPFICVKGKGFFQLPAHLRLPEGYRHKKEVLTSEEAFFVHYELEHLKKFVVKIDPRLNRPKKLKLKLQNLKKEKNTFVVSLAYNSALGEINATHLWQALFENKKYVFTPAGLIFLKNQRFKWLLSVNPKRVLLKSRMLRLKGWEWIKLIVLENIQRPQGSSAQIKKMQKIFDEMNDMGVDELLELNFLKSTLRPYQEIGVKWLSFLYKEGLAGFLCDEMGLGKTHQAMGLLALALQKDKTRNNKYLVVCPTSVIYHWENLLKTFLPEIKVCVFHGLGRIWNETADLILTSYGLIRSQKKLFQEKFFEIVILDELQVAKNKGSKINQALRGLCSSMFLALTGTPLENRLEELKALFDLILPGYFPPDKVFKEYFIEPIEKQKDEKQKMLLTKLVRPFVMRRKKKEVLKDLPEKIEEIAYADLADEQKEIYAGLLSANKNQLIKELKDDNNQQAYLHVFALLTKLKQLCDHPVLIDAKYQSLPSGKWELFKELLHEALDSEQKVVVFSQYLEMIKMIERHLKKNQIQYASVTGSTHKRFEEVKKFQKDPNCKVFVGSLLASGVGIDLTAGSIVIHYDRWWNPAKENQATDRVHRIGQNRGVQVFKLTTKNTIEERIHQLIEKKKMLIEETIGMDDEHQLKALSRDELLSLLIDWEAEEM